MTRTPRILVAALTSVLMLGIFAAPASSAEAGSVEDTTCDALGPTTATFAEAVALGIDNVEEAQEAFDAADSALDASSAALGTTGLAYIRALDGTGNERTTLNAFSAAAIAFSDDVVDYVDTVDDYSSDLMSTGLNSSVLNYLTGLCPA
ncbi:MAG TPA: hypothetical protein VFV09_14630 [Actinomycetota bacterium]|jgi:hypothetical protein|nr:hypothetical protein [Actinomycetota bacterium]